MTLTNVDRTNDALLVLQMEQGSKHAFNVLYEKYWEQTYFSAYKRLKDTDQAKDIVQDIFEKIWLRRNESHIEKLSAYLNIAVRNRVFKLIEKQKGFCPFLDILQNLPVNYLQADADIRRKEFYKSYEELLATLPPKRQVIFRLRFQEDLTPKEIASQLSLSKKTVHNQLNKAIKQLRIALLNLFFFLIIILLFSP